jgi:hypothetical protein
VYHPDTDRYLVIAKVSERLLARKQEAQKIHVERFILKKLSGMDVRKQYQFEISNRFQALNDLNDSKDINRAWDNVKENIKISAKETLGLYEPKRHKPWFDEECRQFLGQRKHAKMQWLQNSNQIT